MNQQVIIVVCQSILLVAVLIGLIIIVLAGAYDIRALSKRTLTCSAIRKLRKDRQPHITVLVNAKNNENDIATCLASIAQSHYHHYDIVVIDRMSTDGTRKAVVSYQQKHPSTPLYMYRKRKASDQMTTIKQGYNKSKKGVLVCVLDATNIISPSFLKQCVAQFNMNDQLQVIRLNRLSDEVHNIITLTWRFVSLSRNLFFKSTSLLSIASVTTPTSGFVYKSSLFTKKSWIKSPPYRYVAGTVYRARESNDLTHTSMRPVYSSRSMTASLVILILFFMTYSFYVAATLQSTALLVLGWIVVAIWLLIIIWSDESSSFAEKLSLSFCTPAYYFVLYAQLIVYGFRSLIRIH